MSDFAGVLSAPAKEKLTALCAEVDQKAHAQIAVVTISSLEGQPIEQFSIDLATAWGIGPKQKDRGVLILLAPNDHRDRIEVGYGLESILPDGKTGGFGREAVPFLRQNDYSDALLLITQRIATVIAEDQKVALDANPNVSVPDREPDHTPSPFGNLVGIIILVIFIFFPLIGFILRVLFSVGGPGGPRRGGGMWMGGPWYGGGSMGGGGSWGGGGGGGFGGFGGGSFGGGGSTGSW
ncbi:MAG TPA: TPM domain-containing protein [Candidatus Saccharimonadales bacterium]|nr:TPM domain-containing protein [Candidatus Saccharimonadales bacterium]